MAKEFSDKNNWFDRPAPAKVAAEERKPTYIAVVCVALVLCVVLGWMLNTMFQGARLDYNTDGSGISNYGDEILSEVITYLKEKYYMDIDEEKWLSAIEYAGSALMFKAGDRYSQLMSPQTYYNFVYSVSDSAANDEIFGISFVVEEGVGLSISSVVAGSNAYGKIQEGDVVLKLANIVDKDGVPPIVDDQSYSDMLIGNYDVDTVSDVLSAAQEADFIVLRFDDSEQGFGIHTVHLERGAIQTVETDYPYVFVEFYFDDEYRNVSMPSDGVEYSIFTERHLDELPEDTGYIRLTQFMDYTYLGENNEPTKVSAADEFKEVMELFKKRNLKHLVLDLKGNPGGNVQYVCDVASLLVTATDKIGYDQRPSVINDNGELLITTLSFPRYNFNQQHWRQSLYSRYFEYNPDKCNIVVWTDGGSASASELLTGALLDYGTAEQMGTTTYGKGIAQTWEELPFYGTVTNIKGEQEKCHWAIYYTCASYYSPFGLNIHGDGYKPANYNNLSTYAALMDAANTYWTTPTGN